MNIDPIDRDTFQHEIVSAAEEMSMALRRSAYSSIIWDMYDYACGLLLPDGEMLAQAETIPAQLGIMRLAAQHMLQAIPAREVARGRCAGLQRSLSGLHPYAGHRALQPDLP